MANPTLTVYMASGGQESDGGGKSTAGHMYYVLTDTNGGHHSFGFAPLSEGSPIGPGGVKNDDDKKYTNLTYDSETVDITQAQYTTLFNFGTPRQPGYMAGFNSHYNFLTNSCVDFVWTALEQIGIGEGVHIPGSLVKPTFNKATVRTALNRFRDKQGAVGNTLPQNQIYDANGNLQSATTVDDKNAVSTAHYEYSADGTTCTVTMKNAAGQVIDVTVIKQDSNTGQVTEDSKDYNPNTAVKTSEITISSDSGTDNTAKISVSGDAPQATMDNAVVTVAANSSAIVTGQGDTVNATTGDTVTIGGNGSTSPDAIIDVVNGTGTNVAIEDNSRVNVGDTNATVTAGQNDNFGAYGAGLSVAANASDGVWIGNNGKSGQVSTVDAAGATIAVVDNSHVEIADGAGSVSVLSDDSVTVRGNGADNIHVLGDSDLTDIYANSENVSISGNGDRTNNFGNGETTTNSGIQDQTNNYGSNDHTADTGERDQVYDANSSDGFSGNSSDVAENGFGDDQGYYGFAGPQSKVASKIASTDIGVVGNFDKTRGNTDGALVASRAKEQAQWSLASNAISTIDGSVWDHQVITWSLDGESDRFSGKIGHSDEAAVEKAFAAWAAASGLTFKEVEGNTKADINVGWEKFDTAESGVVGYTTLESSSGHTLAGAVIGIEDRYETALVKSDAGERVYSGTDATLSQVLEHEIGHALGLAESPDANSVESYYLGKNNRSLGSSDTSAIQAIYGRVAGINGSYIPSADQLIQSMGALAPQSAGAITPHRSLQPRTDHMMVAMM